MQAVYLSMSILKHKLNCAKFEPESHDNSMTPGNACKSSLFYKNPTDTTQLSLDMIKA